MGRLCCLLFLLLLLLLGPTPPPLSLATFTAASHFTALSLWDYTTKISLCRTDCCHDNGRGAVREWDASVIVCLIVNLCAMCTCMCVYSADMWAAYFFLSFLSVKSLCTCWWMQVCVDEYLLKLEGGGKGFCLVYSSSTTTPLVIIGHAGTYYSKRGKAKKYVQRTEQRVLLLTDRSSQIDTHSQRHSK